MKFCNKCQTYWSPGIEQPACPHYAVGILGQLLDAGPEDFGGTDDGSHYMSQTAIDWNAPAQTTPREDIENMRKVMNENGVGEPVKITFEGVLRGSGDRSLADVVAQMVHECEKYRELCEEIIVTLTMPRNQEFISEHLRTTAEEWLMRMRHIGGSIFPPAHLPNISEDRKGRCVNCFNDFKTGPCGGCESR